MRNGGREWGIGIGNGREEWGMRNRKWKRKNWE